jgi:hypothetical protein
MRTDVIDAPQTDTLAPRDNAVMPGFSNNANWELAQRVAKAFSASNLVPQNFQGNLPNCLIALEMANRMGASPLMVMQSLYVVHGTPSWSSKFLIACFNQCGRFSSLRYEWNADKTACRAWATEKATGERIEGPQVSMQMAKDEGWSGKNGSKWKTMPELMLMYRSAAFLIRTYAPEISMGLRTDDELHDLAPVEEVRQASGLQAVRAALTQAPAGPTPSALPVVFDYLAAMKKIEASADREILALFADEFRELPDSPERDALLDAYRARDAALSGE